MYEQFILKNRIKEIRKGKNYSQSDLAEIVGVSRNTIGAIERGDDCPSARLAMVLCVVLDKKFEDLFYLEEEVSEERL